MRSRILVIVLSLVVLVLLGLGVPLALSLAGSQQQRMFVDRLTITARLASLAQRPLLTGQADTIKPVLQRYQDVYGVSSAVVNQDSTLAVSTGVGMAQWHDAATQGDLDDALGGRQPEQTRLLLPWQDQPMVVAEPVMVDGEVHGAVVTISSTGQLRERMLVWWLVVFAGGLLALGLGIVLALPVVRWILRPIRRMDEAIGRVVTAVTGGTELPPLPTSGPPELRELARSFDQMAASVGDVFAAQRAFVADASHQLRNPLTALQIRLSSLDGQVADESAEDYAAAVAESQRLAQVLDELLVLARAEASSAAPVVTDASAILAERVEAWQVVAETRDVELRLEAVEGLRVLAIPRAVDGVLDALLDNALKFAADGPADVHSVEVTGHRDSGESVVITVRDHGPGLELGELARATDRFWRSSRHPNVSGSGLGLAIAQRFIQRSGGTLQLELPDGGGLRVVIKLRPA